MSKETALCKLNEPATCLHRIDGRMSHTILCGGNRLLNEVKECPYRALAEIKELAATDSQQPQPAMCLGCEYWKLPSEGHCMRGEGTAYCFKVGTHAGVR